MSKTGGRTDSAHRPRAHHFAHPTPEPAPTPTPDRVGEALAGMTVEQKAAQLLVAGIEGTEPGEDAVQAIQGYQVGGVILFGRNVESAEQLAALTNGLKELNGDYVPLFLCVDQEGGRVDRMPPEVTDLPSALDFGSIADPEARMDACFTLGQTLAAQCAALRRSTGLRPQLDIWSNPENTVIGDRAFGTDAATVTGAANETALGILSGGVIPVAKHFPGHGDTAVDSHYGLPVVDKSLEELEELELRPFRQGHRHYLRLRYLWGGHLHSCHHGGPHPPESDRPGQPGLLSPEVVTGLLREGDGL